jgi:predicted metal-dependent hydrolase
MTATGKDPVPHRELRARRVCFTHAQDGLSRHYVDDDLFMSHFVAVLSATFPPGEDFFVRSVRHYLDQITDPELVEQVRGFIGQEVVHGREHDHLNHVLRAMGYPTHWVQALMRSGLAISDWTLPPRVRLGYTAGLEHYTATIAERLLTSERAQALLGDTQVRSLLLWHMLEESEHKAVAFDVYRAVGGTEQMRIWSMRAISAVLFTFLSAGTALSMMRDPAAYNPIRLCRSMAALRHSPFLDRQMVRRLRAYNKPGFHPDDFDSTELVAHWRAQLFGPEGELTETGSISPLGKAGSGRGGEGPGQKDL